MGMIFNFFLKIIFCDYYNDIYFLKKKCRIKESINLKLERMCMYYLGIIIVKYLVFVYFIFSVWMRLNFN